MYGAFMYGLRGKLPRIEGPDFGPFKRGSVYHVGLLTSLISRNYRVYIFSLVNVLLIVTQVYISIARINGMELLQNWGRAWREMILIRFLTTTSTSLINTFDHDGSSRRLPTSLALIQPLSAAIDAFISTHTSIRWPGLSHPAAILLILLADRDARVPRPRCNPVEAINC